MDSFFILALLMAGAFSLLAGPLGSIMIWRRLSFFGDTIAHGTLLGLAISYAFHADPFIIMVGFCILIAVILMYISGRNPRAGLSRTKTSSDTLLAIFSHGSLALGLVALSLLKAPISLLNGFLFGDILSISKNDVLITVGCSAVVILTLALFWRQTLLTFISEDLATSDNIPVQWIKFGFALILGLTIGLLLKTIGALLMTALLIIPAATARFFSTSPLGMMKGASLFCFFSFCGGLWLSYLSDAPTGPAIVTTAFFVFCIMAFMKKIMNKFH